MLGFSKGIYGDVVAAYCRVFLTVNAARAFVEMRLLPAIERCFMQLVQPILKDTQGRTFPYLRLSITDLCNFRCNYCLPDGCQSHSHGESLSVDEIKRLVSFSQLGVRKIRLTGRTDLAEDFLEVVETIKSVEGIQTLAMTIMVIVCISE